MNRKELVVGQEYHVDKIPGWATYAGIHDGILIAADGTEYHGAKGGLRFVYGDGNTRMVRIIGDARDIIESRQAEEARVKLQETRAANLAMAKVKALDQLRAWGFPLNDEGHLEDENGRRIYQSLSIASLAESVGGVSVNYVTMRDLYQVARCGMGEDPLLPVMDAEEVVDVEDEA